MGLLALGHRKPSKVAEEIGLSRPATSRQLRRSGRSFRMSGTIVTCATGKCARTCACASGGPAQARPQGSRSKALACRGRTTPK
ncbi:MAG: hypothetical protein H0X68_11375 [Chloroflexi bacterium]|nr:hypothetical protein [Chloroflexota bacterium]